MGRDDSPPRAGNHREESKTAGQVSTRNKGSGRSRIPVEIMGQRNRVSSPSLPRRAAFPSLDTENFTMRPSLLADNVCRHQNSREIEVCSSLGTLKNMEKRLLTVIKSND